MFIRLRDQLMAKEHLENDVGLNIAFAKHEAAQGVQDTITMRRLQFLSAV